MGWGWASAGRMRPMRMVSDHGYHYPKFEIVKLQRPDIQRHTRCRPEPCGNELRFDAVRWMNHRLPGRSGDWPLGWPRKRRVRSL